MILFIDDEGRRMKSYAEELEFSMHQVVHFETDVGSALKYLCIPDITIDLIILDVMMSPGDVFQSEDTEYGLKTGLLLYGKIRAQFKKMPIVIFTNASDASLAKEVEEDKSCLFLQKEDYLPSEFSEELQCFLKQQASFTHKNL